MTSTRAIPLIFAVAALGSAGCAGSTKTYVNKGAAMEPTIHCTRPNPGCEGENDDRVEAEEVESDELERGDIVLFETPPQALELCGVGGRFIKRIVGLP